MPSEAQTKRILEEIDQLPTLSSVAVRVLQLSGGSDADVHAMIALVESDPALTVKVLSLCRKASITTAHSVETVERAILLMGMQAVRSALLSVEVFGLFSPEEAGEGACECADPTGFWIHSLAVACGAELLAERHSDRLQAARPEEAFLCGLLHDLGKLALQSVLPRAYNRVLEIAREKRVSLQEAEKAVLGLDHHGAGRRLAERWGLPLAVQDAMWLHAMDPVALPQLPHTPTLRAVNAADAIARAFDLGWTGSHDAQPKLGQILESCGYPAHAGDDLREEIIERTAERAAGLGLSDDQGAESAIEWVTGANQELGRLNSDLAGEARESAAREHTLEIVTRTLRQSTRATNTRDAIEVVAKGAADALRSRVHAIVWQPREGAAWMLFGVGASCEISRLGELDPSELPGASLGEIFARAESATRVGLAMHAIAGAMGGASIEEYETLPIVPGHGPAAIILHDPAGDDGVMSDDDTRASLIACFGAVLSAASRHEGAKRVGEEISSASRRLASETHERAQQMSDASIAAITAGAAHELNNPLTIIAGQAQLLERAGLEINTLQSVHKIQAAASRASALIASVHEIATVSTPERETVSLARVLASAIEMAREAVGEGPGADALKSVRSRVSENVPNAIFADALQIAGALAELLINAAQSGPRSPIVIGVDTAEGGSRLVVSVEDNGCGMTSETLAHAKEPFFSKLPAGRRPGLGLARACRLIEAHGGVLRLESVEGRGTRAFLELPEESWAHTQGNEAAA